MAGELLALLEHSAARNPHAPAIGAPGRQNLDYRALLDQITEIHERLHAVGLGPTSRIATVLANGPEAAVISVALATIGACAPLNPGYGADELRFYLEDCGADALIIASRDTGPAREMADSLGLTVIELDFDPDWPAGRIVLNTDTVRTARRAHTASSRPDAALILHTSGTTARPKIVPLTQANLAASAQQIAAHLALSPADCGLNVMPLFHIHGLLGSLLASLAGGASLICTPGFDDKRFFDWVAATQPSWYTAVPTIHQAVLACAHDYRAKTAEHRFRFIRSSSASLPPRILADLEALFDAPVIEAYGMTEASHQMSSNPLPPAVRKPGTVGISAGAELAILDASGQQLQAGATGEIAIRGPGVTAAYEANPDANASAFDNGWFRTGDLGRLDDDGYLSIAGRIKEIVNRGGEKISPREIDEALLEHPAVAQVAAFSVPHPSLGEDLVAAIVLKADVPADETSIREFLFGRLSEHKIPSRLLFVDAIPKGPTGKVQRTNLHKALADALGQTFEAPDNETERFLATTIGEILARSPVGRNDNFFALGGDSLRGARVVNRINEQLDLRMPVTELFRYPTIAELGARIQALLAEPAQDDAMLQAEIDAMSDEDVERLLAEYEQSDADEHSNGG